MCVIACMICMLCDMTAEEPNHQKNVKLFILSGQSNAAGNGNGDDLSESQIKTDPEVLIYRGRDSNWEEMYPQRKGKPKFDIKDKKFGVEMSFSKELKKMYPDDIIAICKVGVRGATSIIAWEKDHDRSGFKKDMLEIMKVESLDTKKKQVHLYHDIINGVKKGIGLLKLKSEISAIEVSGMLWLQTEKDGRLESSAKAYKQRLRNLIENVRTDLNSPNLVFMYMDSHCDSDHDNRNIMKKDFRDLANEMKRIGLVENNDLPTYEGVHFTSEGLWTLGERFKDKYLEMTN